MRFYRTSSNISLKLTTGDLLKDGKKIAPIIIWFDKKFIK